MVRQNAVDCISRLTALPYAQLHPFKDLVCKGLAKVLDDPKRFVRRRAVVCRNQWCLLAVDG